MSDKRSHIRFISSGTVKIKTEGDAPKILEANLIDIGFRGFSVNLEENIGAGTIVQFELITAAWKTPLTGRGKISHVVESSKYGNQILRHGVQFVDVSEDTMLLLLTKIRKKIAADRKKKRASMPRDIDDYVY